MLRPQVSAAINAAPTAPALSSRQADRRAKGADLQDHVVAPLRFRSTKGVSICRQLNLFGRARLAAEWLVFKTGLGATNFFEVGAFFKSDETLPYFNMQHEFLPFLADFQSGRVTISDGFQYFVS